VNLLFFFPATTSLNNVINYEGLFQEMYTVIWDSYFWLIVFLCTAALSLPLLAWITGSEYFNPTISMVARLVGKREEKALSGKEGNLNATENTQSLLNNEQTT